MANSKLLKEAIADAKAVRETAIANAKIALEEAFTPKLQSILSKKLQAEMNEEEDEKEEEMDESVDSSEIGKGGEPKYDEAHTELDPETDKESASVGLEDSNVDKVDDLKEGEDSEEEVEETVSEENEAEVKEETEEVSEETEEVSEMGYKEEDDEEEVDEELNLEDIIKELESELSEEEGEDDEEVEELHGDKEGSHGEEEGSHGEEEMADMDEMEDEKEDDMDEDIDLDEILREMGYGEEEEEDMDESNESNQVEELTKELEEAYATVKELKGTINEVNLLNAKLLYANKLFRSYAMNNDQKSKVVETLDRTKSVREVKLVFATLAESMKFGGETKRKTRVTEGIASKPQASTAPKKEIISESNEIANRFKKLANIK